MFELPELPQCPYHPLEPPKVLAGCQICWSRFYIPFEYGPQLTRVTFVINDYISRVERAKQFIALRQEGFETEGLPPKNQKVEFALPNGERVLGRNIDDFMGGTYPVRDNADESPISSFMGWRVA